MIAGWWNNGYSGAFWSQDGDAGRKQSGDKGNRYGGFLLLYLLSVLKGLGVWM